MKILPSVLLGAVARSNRLPGRSEVPRDCVREFPTLNPETTELVGFDSAGVPQIKVEIPRDEDIGEWNVWLLRWVRRRDRSALKASMRVIG